MIHWNVDPTFVHLGPLTIRYYGLLFAAAFLVGYQIMLYIFKKENKPEDDLNDLIWFMIIGTVVGARLGHCLFYNPGFYLSNPIEILKIWEGGLASHGAAIGILITLYLYSKRKRGQSYLWVLDRVVITVALGGAFIRLGNLFNSEIIGIPTDVAWAFVFERFDDAPRHPAQLYESIAYLIIFFVLFNFYKKRFKKLIDGQIFGLFLMLVFGFRFFVEFLKANQTYFEKGMALNMGQLLSIPLVIAGIYFVAKTFKKETTTPN